jgi:general secretion pathway protein C
MQLTIDRYAIAQNAPVALANIAALALLGVVGGYWTWQWLAPRAESQSPVRAESSGQIASALELFGLVERENGAMAATGLAMQLLGVAAAREGRDAYAILILDGKQIVATRRGEEIAPGIKLAEVAPDHVVLDRNGVRETLAWPEKTAAPGNPAQRTNR